MFLFGGVAATTNQIFRARHMYELLVYVFAHCANLLHMNVTDQLQPMFGHIITAI